MDTTSSLNPDTDIKTIFISLMEKLSKFAAQLSYQEGGGITNLNKDLDIFCLFKKYTDKIIEEQGSKLDVRKLLELETAFMNFSIKT